MKHKSSNKKSTSVKRAPDAKQPDARGGVHQSGTTSEARFQAIFEGSRDAIGISAAGIHMFTNPAYLELFGFPPGTDLAGKPILDLIAPESRDQIMAYITRRIRGESAPSAYETRGLRTDGAVFDMEVNVSLYRENGKDLAVVILRDVTERKRAEEDLRRSEARFKAITMTASDAILLMDDKGKIVYWNPAAERIFGYSAEEATGRDLHVFLAPQRLHGEYLKGFSRFAMTGQGPVINRSVEMAALKKDGTEFPIEISTSAMSISGKWHALGIVRDISERKQAEQAIREKEGRYRTLFEAANDGIFIQDATGFIDCNDKGAVMYGLPKEKIIGRSPAEFAPERQPNGRLSAEVAAEKVQAALNGNPQVFEWQPMRADRNLFDVEITLSRLALGGSVCLQAIVRDITERKHAEATLRENQARLDLALQSAHMGVWSWDIKENRRYFDDLTCKLLGIDATTFTGTLEEFFRAVHPEDRERIKSALARVIEQDVLYELTYRVIWQDGSVHDITTRGRLVRDDEGQPERINGILWDSTGQRLLEEELIKTQKLESLGTLAGGIAHDFNNLLQGVFGFISMAKITLDQKEKSLAMLTQAEKALHQSVNLTSQLLTFSKGGKPVKKVYALRPLIENAVAFALSGSRVNYEIVVDEGLRAVEVDEGQIGQVIQNIVLNADQAMTPGSMIRISMRNMPATAIIPPIDLHGDLVEISIRDQGAGIPPEHLTKIFDPYFTTKDKGSGLGLATVYSIIKNHGGLIRVQSEVGKGTTFLIYLPASHAAVEEPKSSVMPAATRKGRILIMDDEEVIRVVAGELLAALGHDVAFAKTGEEALDTYRAALEVDRPFDVVILDLTIRGGMGGMEALLELVKIDQNIKAVVSSGYSDDAALSNYRKQGFRSFLKKPYNVEELQRTLNSLLA